MMKLSRATRQGVYTFVRCPENNIHIATAPSTTSVNATAISIFVNIASPGACSLRAHMKTGLPRAKKTAPAIMYSTPAAYTSHTPYTVPRMLLTSAAV